MAKYEFDPQQTGGTPKGRSVTAVMHDTDPAGSRSRPSNERGGGTMFVERIFNEMMTLRSVGAHRMRVIATSGRPMSATVICGARSTADESIIRQHGVNTLARGMHQARVLHIVPLITHRPHLF